MENSDEMIIRAINGAGTLIEKIDNDIILKDVITDSLTFVSFFIEIEQEFDIEIPDEEYGEKLLEYSIAELKELIKRCGGGE